MPGIGWGWGQRLHEFTDPCTMPKSISALLACMDDMILSALIRKEGRQYTAWNPELDIASQGPDPERALANLRQAVELYLEDADAELPTGTPLFATFEVHHAPKDASAVGA